MRAMATRLLAEQQLLTRHTGGHSTIAMHSEQEVYTPRAGGRDSTAYSEDF